MVKGTGMVMRELRDIRVFLMLFVMLFAGCAANEISLQGTGTASAAGQITKEELRDQLNGGVRKR